jgi:sugar/nucleoside kinase (ribokinase family)
LFEVTCVGILVTDVMVKTVDKIPDKGKLGLVDNINLFIGGCAANSAIDMAKLGLNTAIVGMVGEDAFGDFMRNELSKNEVNIDGLVACQNASSASIVLSDSSGERTFLHCLGANGVFSEKSINYSIIENSKIIFVAGCMLMPSFDGEDCAKFLKKAKEMGKITALDTAWDDTGKWMKTLEGSMQYIDYFIPSIDEAQQLSKKQKPEDIAAFFFSKGVKHVVIKLGKDGCYFQENASSAGQYLPSYKIKAVDTTGAGDSFCAGFLYGISKNMGIKESCRLANAVGAHCVMEMGATAGIKSYAQTLKFMEENPL